jgi:arylsulfatase A-like enzyme
VTARRVLLLVLAAGCGGRPARPNLLLVSIDTLRADRLGCYGYERATSPALDRFAREHARRFEHAVAEAPWTLPSHVTMLSGLHPLRHGVSLPEHAPGGGVELLAETLHGAGYDTFAFTGGGWLSAPWGFARGFDAFHAGEVDCADNAQKLLEMIRAQAPGRPWFGFLHTYEVHCPYDPPEPYRYLFESPDATPIEVAGRCGNPDFNSAALAPGQARFLSDRYDESIRSVDDGLGAFLAELERSGVLANTVVVITSDHGDEFGEHGRIGHEHSLQREVLEIPLLVAGPGIRPGTAAEPVGLADVVPTVLELLGLPARPSDGRSLVPWLRGAGGSSRTEPCLSVLSWKENLLSTLDERRHLVLDRARGEARLYDLRADPGEQAPASVTEAELEMLASKLERRANALAGEAIPPRRAGGMNVASGEVDGKRR